MKIKITSILLIVAGLLLLGYPVASDMYYNDRQQRLVEQWQEVLVNMDNMDDDSSLEEAAASDVAIQGPVLVEAASDLDTDRQGSEGLLIIDKINLLLPILHGATHENMKTTVASILNTGTAGKIGNYAIAGHRNRTYGRNFNRLDELETGDIILVHNGEKRFEYVVTEKLIVEPEDTWVLEGNGQDQEITLVTCHPIVNPTHRLIIKGIIKA